MRGALHLGRADFPVAKAHFRSLGHNPRKLQQPPELLECSVQSADRHLHIFHAHLYRSPCADAEVVRVTSLSRDMQAALPTTSTAQDIFNVRV